MIGQSYDGAANMAGVNNSVQTHIQEDWPHAQLVHCYAHKLALVVKSACNYVEVFLRQQPYIFQELTQKRMSPREKDATGWVYPMVNTREMY